MSQRERYVKIHPIGFTSNIYLVVREVGFMAVVAALHTIWDHRVGAWSRNQKPLPDIGPVYFHFSDVEHFEHTPCEFISREKIPTYSRSGCRMEFASVEMLKKAEDLPRILVKDGSDAALDFLEEEFYDVRLKEWMDQ